MTEYFVPARGGESELVEKRSRFLGHLRPVESEEEARAFIAQMKKEHYDARHNCWCYLLKDGPERYSDDGEPQGTAGIPMLELFRREGVTNLVCVVTRYFGGVLLGTGGLLRAYTQSAKDALTAAGRAAVRAWREIELSCPYALLERVRQETAAFGGAVGSDQFEQMRMRRGIARDETREQLRLPRAVRIDPFLENAHGLVPRIPRIVFIATPIVGHVVSPSKPLADFRRKFTAARITRRACHRRRSRTALSTIVRRGTRAPCASRA